MRDSRRPFLKRAALGGGGLLTRAAGLNAAAPWIWDHPLRVDANQSFWSLEKAGENAALMEDLKVDVAIVGGGLTGLAAAYFICRASPGKSVCVLEARGMLEALSAAVGIGPRARSSHVSGPRGPRRLAGARGQCVHTEFQSAQEFDSTAARTRRDDAALERGGTRGHRLALADAVQRRQDSGLLLRIDQGPSRAHRRRSAVL